MAQAALTSQTAGFLRDVACDPALGFALCGMIYASKATAVAQVCAFTCALLIIALRMVRRLDLTFLPTHIAMSLHDDGLTLRVLGTLGLASSVSTFGTIAFGHFSDGSLSMAVLQGSAGLLFAVANFMLAASMSGRRAISHPMITLLLQAETWMLGGMLCLGLMTGAQALIMLPFLMVGYGMTLHNVRHQRPEHTAHPKLWYAAATLGFAAISPDYALLCANLLNAACLIVLEHRLTPCGLWPRTARVVRT